MNRRYAWIAVAVIAVLLLAFFLWPQTPGQIEDPVQPGGAITEEPTG
jgi:nitrogen fixation-related uncharacterized protein